MDGKCSGYFHVLGSVMGPHPYPEMVRDFRPLLAGNALQILEKEGKLPMLLWLVLAAAVMPWVCFMILIPDEKVKLVGVEAAGRGVNTAETAATIARGSEGIFHGHEILFSTRWWTDKIAPVYSISAGLIIRVLA